jgi:hypothetical protein
MTVALLKGVPTGTISSPCVVPVDVMGEWFPWFGTESDERSCLVGQ